jgi:septum formation protein
VLESPDMHPLDREVHQLYLASNSPRRKELLSLIGLEYALLPAPVDEKPFPGEDGAAYVMRIAHSKASAAARVKSEGMILAADTAVVDRQAGKGTKILGKPVDQQEATAMLRSLRGHTHQVFTAIAIRPSPGGTIVSDLCTTDVPMREYSDAEIETYVASDDPLDKAGAYAIQHLGFHPVDHLQGCYANVMGLPLCHVARNLFKLGIIPAKNVPQSCQAALDYVCPVYRSILEDKAPELLLVSSS